MIFPDLKRLLPMSAAALLAAGCATKAPLQSPQTAALDSAPFESFSPPAVQPAAYIPPAGLTRQSGAPTIFAESAILIDAHSGEVLYAKNADEARPVASTQKLLTALLVAEQGNLHQPVTVAESDTRVEPSKLYLRAGDSYTRGQLLTAILVKSCNDAAECLGRSQAGSRQAFAAEMNRKAMELGARNSHFVNPHGLPAAGQYSTARDMARIAFAAYRDPLLRSIMRTRETSFAYADGRVRVLENTNELLKRSSIYTGMKTGTANVSGRCLVASASDGGREVIVVQLRSKTKYLWDDADKLVQWALNRRQVAWQ